MKNSFFSRFTPQSNQYFTFLSQMADTVCKTAELAYECIQAKSHEDIVKYSDKIRDQKRAGTNLQERIIQELHNTFITPFDREDINSLATYLKETNDHISSCAKRIMLYYPIEMPSGSDELAIQVRNSAEALREATDKLADLKKNPKEVSSLCKKIEEIENKADEVYEHLLTNLFHDEKDAIKIIKLKDIFHELESATDSAEHVGKIISTIVIKYA